MIAIVANHSNEIRPSVTGNIKPKSSARIAPIDYGRIYIARNFGAVRKRYANSDCPRKAHEANKVNPAISIPVNPRACIRFIVSPARDALRPELSKTAPSRQRHQNVLGTWSTNNAKEIGMAVLIKIGPGAPVLESRICDRRFNNSPGTAAE